MSEDLEKEMEKATLLPNRFYMILNHEDEDSFSMSAYDTTVGEDEDELSAGLVVLSGMIELLESDFERVWDAGMARISFASMVKNIQIEFENDEEGDNKNLKEVADKVIEREDNIVKVNFGEKQ